MSVDTKQARRFADHAEALEYPVGIVNILRELADEVDRLREEPMHNIRLLDDLETKWVDRLREDARVDDEDCAQALKTNGELCDNNAELTGDVITKWEPLLAAAKVGHRGFRGFHHPSEGIFPASCPMCKAIAACEEK